MSVSKSLSAEGEKLPWLAPSMNVVVTVAQVASSVGPDVDEDWSGTPS
ncbi:hypothetical protein [Aurantiacibacter zhengii]|nr:hypothetical protein [Aurantiacibacter zhengii]